MARTRLTSELWRRWLTGELSAAEVRALGEHHLATCATCRRLMEALQNTSSVVPAATGAGAEPYISEERRATEEKRGRRERAAARRDLSELLSLAPKKRLAKIRRAFSRFRSPLLVDLLIDRSEAAASREPREALALAESALEVAMRLEHREIGAARAMTAVARANAFRGNALRVLRDLAEAEQLLGFALQCFRREGSGEPEVEAKLLSLLASLRSDQGRFEEAGLLLDRCVELYRRLQSRHGLSVTLIKIGVLHSLLGEPDEARRVTLEALGYMDRGAEPKLYLSAQHNLTGYLGECGQWQEAEKRMAANAPLYDQFTEPWTQLRRLWLKGKIAFGLGDVDRAERIFLAVQKGYVEEDLSYLAGVVGLELALVAVARGDARRVRELAEEVLLLLHDQGLSQESTAALMLFNEAARNEAVSSAMVEELIDRLRRKRDRA